MSMPENNSLANKRIAKNTVLLYMRMLLLLAISLYTSRIVLNTLGVTDYGIYNVVGGVITILGFVTGSLGGATSRYITTALGKGNKHALLKLFSSILFIHYFAGAIIFVLSETVGLWFVLTQLNIPNGRMPAAMWVYQLSILAAIVNMISIPYNAVIIAHEKMSAFAWFSIIESTFRLVIVYLLFISPYDKLITLSVLSLCVSVSMRFAQRIYCSKKFSECSYTFIFDKSLLKEMTGFAGWTFLTHTSWIFNTQGINLLINIFFGVAFNAARGLATSIEGMIVKFCNDFTTALKPQITKSYAAGEIDDMNKLICRGARFSYYLLFIMSLPLMFEAHAVIYLWLGQVPDYTVMFFRLTVIFTLIRHLGTTGYTGCMATGRIKWYTIIITSVGFLVFPLTWIAYKLNAPVEYAYYISIVIYALLTIIRLYIMRHLWGFPISMFFTKVILPVVKVTILSLILPAILYLHLEQGIIKALIVMFTSVLSGILVTFIFGLSVSERSMILNKSKAIVNKFAKK